MGAVSRADAGGDAFGGIDGDGEIGTEGLTILRDHALEVEVFGDVESDGHTEHAAAFAHHKGDDFRGDELCGAHQVALVFAIFVIGDNHHFTSADIGNDIVDTVEGEIRRSWHGERKERHHIRREHAGSLWGRRYSGV